MSVLSNASERKNKGVAWAWLKSQLQEQLGSDAAGVLLAGYYERLNEEYRDRRRLAGARELPALQAKRDTAALAGRSVEVRKLERMIAERLRWLEED